MAACNSSGDTGEVGSSISASISSKVIRGKNKLDIYFFFQIIIEKRIRIETVTNILKNMYCHASS